MSSKYTSIRAKLAYCMVALFHNAYVNKSTEIPLLGLVARGVG